MRFIFLITIFVFEYQIFASVDSIQQSEVEEMFAKSFIQKYETRLEHTALMHTMKHVSVTTASTTVNDMTHVTEFPFLEHRLSYNQLFNEFNATPVYYKSNSEQCDDYGLNYNLYPSLFGFKSCETLTFNSNVFISNRGIACKSSGLIEFAIFTKNSKGEQMECFNVNSTFRCFPRRDTHKVCGCSSCTKESILDNLPITSYKSSRKVISFSLYGENMDYICGVLRQIRLAKIFLPDWSSRVYLNSSVPQKYIKIISKEAKVFKIPETSMFINSGMFWRFLVADDNTVDVYCIRDADSIFTHREAVAIRKWMKSGKAFNSMRDHEFHSLDILGGLWCGQQRIRNIARLMLNWRHRNEFNDDQIFLNKVIWPIVRQRILIFDSCKNRRNGENIVSFPINRIACEFIGIAHRKFFYMWGYYEVLCFEDY